MMNAINLLLAAIVSAHLSLSPVPTCHRDCQLSEHGIDLITLFEGYSPFVYKDAAGLPTIGIGHLIRPGEKFVEPLMPQDAEKLLRKDAALATAAVNRLVRVPLRQTQADALISFTFNLGEGSLSRSTLLKRVNTQEHDKAAREFLKWVYAAGQKLNGLVTRRQTESRVYAMG